MNNTSMAEAVGVHETAKSLTESLRQYIEAQYHIRDEGLVRERHALLQANATIARPPTWRPRKSIKPVKLISTWPSRRRLLQC